MALPRKVQPVPPNGFVAAATRLPAVRPRRTGTAQGWQAEAWKHYNTLGEVRFVANWNGNMMSRARLVAAKQVGTEYVPLDSGPAADAIAAYFGGMSGQAEMLQQTGIHLSIPGECIHVMRGSEEQWMVLSSSNVKQTGKDITLTIDGERVPVKRGEIVIRVWTPHPVDSQDADSPMRSNMSILSEVQQLNAHVLTQLDSRLVGAGILFVPAEIQFATPEGIDPQANQADAFVQVLGDVMSLSIKDRGSAAAHVPIVVTAPGEYLDKVQHLTFWTDLDESVIPMREHAIKRLALGMDTPPEIMLGIGDSTHWNSWLVSEEAIKSHLEPKLQVMVNAITTAYLRPAITDLVPDPENYVVLADTSQIRMRPNRSNEALELYDRGELSGPALRRETGFQPADALIDTEFALWLLKKVATGSTSPEQTVAALAKLGIDLGITPEPEPNTLPGDDRRIDARRKVRDTRTPDPQRSMDEKVTRDTGLAAACEVLVYRALERAGNKLVKRPSKPGMLDATPVHERYLHTTASPDTLLMGTWDCAEEVLSTYTASPAAVVSILDIYVRGLITAQEKHTREALESAMAQLVA